MHPPVLNFCEQWLVTIWLVTCSDIAVTIPVAWTLDTSCTGFKQTDVPINIILWTLNTSALPAFVSSCIPHLV
ncbi:hypothetical protein BS47DRAFT_1093003, partial [Hydnum rufescens UP504]